MKRLILCLLTLVMAAAMLVGCAASNEDQYYSSAEYTADDASYDMDWPEAAAGEANDGASAAAPEEESDSGGPSIDYDNSMLTPTVNRKVIFSGSLSIETTNFDDDLSRIKSALAGFNGYIENQDVSGTKPVNWNDKGRTGRLTLRVPSKNFDAFINQLEGFGETISISTSGRDVSLQYFDTDTRLRTLRIRQERLLDLLENAKGLEDIIKLEQELSNVDYQIQSLEIELRNYDSLIDFSTITIEIFEVNQVERVTTKSDPDLGTRIKNGFFSVLNVLAEIGEGLLVFLLAGSPVIIPLAAICALIIVLAKRRNRKKAKKLPPDEE